MILIKLTRHQVYNEMAPTYDAPSSFRLGELTEKYGIINQKGLGRKVLASEPRSDA